MANQKRQTTLPLDPDIHNDWKAACHLIGMKYGERMTALLEFDTKRIFAHRELSLKTENKTGEALIIEKVPIPKTLSTFLYDNPHFKEPARQAFVKVLQEELEKLEKEHQEALI